MNIYIYIRMYAYVCIHMYTYMRTHTGLSSLEEFFFTDALITPDDAGGAVGVQRRAARQWRPGGTTCLTLLV